MPGAMSPDNTKILVFGGTTEGRQLTEHLTARCIPHIYSTKTVTPQIDNLYRHCRHGALDETQLRAFCHTYTVSKILDASHPFATKLHRTLAHFSRQQRLPLWRLERPFDPRVNHPLVHYVNTYDEALTLLLERPHDTLLALTGVNSIPKLELYWRQRPCFFRVLNRPESKRQVLNAGFPFARIIFSMPHDSVTKEVQAWCARGIGAVLCKESGRSGFLHIKIEAALTLGIPLVIVARPPLPEGYRTFTSLKLLLDELSEQEGKWT